VRKVLFVPAIMIAMLVFGATTYAGDCSCTTAKTVDGWCQDCKVGYFAGVKIQSKKLYDALEGQPVADTASIKCPACKAAIQTDGRCDHCQAGFAHKTKYSSKVAYRLARGKAMGAGGLTCSGDAAKCTGRETKCGGGATKCSGCAGQLADRGWCEGCKIGLVGNRVFKDKATYDEAVQARETLKTAAKTAEKCEACAVAMVTDGGCTTCKVSFKDGKKMAKAVMKKAEADTP
jgi:hypothetical protein